MGAADLPAVPAVLEGVDRSVDQPRRRVLRAAGEHAELVASQPVGRAQRIRRDGQAAAQPLQQRISGRVTERVVVLLEPIEVEHHEQELVRPDRLGDRLGQVGRERPAIAEAGQGVGPGLELALTKQGFLLTHEALDDTPGDDRAEVEVREHGQQEQHRRRRPDLDLGVPTRGTGGVGTG